MNYGTLKTIAAKYVNRKDILWDELCPLAADDISLQLTVQENEAISTLVMAPETHTALYSGAVPPDFARVRAVFSGQNELYATDMQGLLAAGDQSRLYVVSGMAILSGVSTDLTLVYSSREEAFTTDSDTSLVLSRYSQIWLYGLITHAAHRIQDFDAEEAHSMMFDAAIATANANYDLSRLSAGAPSRRVYAPAGG